MINIIADTLIDAANNPERQSLIVKHLKNIFQRDDHSEPVLVQFHGQHSPSALNGLKQQLKDAGWTDNNLRLHRWHPIQGLDPQHANNQLLRSYAASRHGAHLDLHLASWPHAAESCALPQALVLMDAGWSPTRLSSLKLSFQRRQLIKHLENYAVIGVDNDSALARALQLDSDRYVPIAKLLDALTSIEPTATSERQSLAWVTPMPPIHSGIATYSATLLPDLRQHFDVTVVTDDPDPEQPEQRSTDWLMDNGHRFDRICYHIGNSPYHQTIQECALRWPGALVLHDLYLGDLQFSYEAPYGSPGQPPNQRWMREIYRCHGYHAIQEAALEDGLPLNTLRKYHTNRHLIKRSLGVIVHSQDAEQRIESIVNQVLITRVPMVNMPRRLPNREQSRQSLGLNENIIQICSVGMVGSAKGSLEILQAWAKLPDAIRSQTQLVFMGDNEAGAYGEALLQGIKRLDVSHQVLITGWTSDATYNQYLASCDFALQLRSVNRGESSAAALDVICSGIPTIINAMGSMRELSQASVLAVPEQFTPNDLSQAMQSVIADLENYSNRARNNQQHLRANHSPNVVASSYHTALETIYAKTQGIEQLAIRTIAARTRSNHLWDSRIAAAIANNFPPQPDEHLQLLVDVTQIARHDLKTGIQRVVRAIVLEWMRSFNDNIRIEPVYLCSEGEVWHYRYAREWTFQLLGCTSPGLKDEEIEVTAGDQMLLLDLAGGYLVEAKKAGVYERLTEQGVTMTGVVYDILPILHPSFFPDGSQEAHRRWLMAIADISAQLVCISRAVAEETSEYLTNHAENTTRPAIQWFHLGADLGKTGASEGWHEEHDALEKQLQNSTTFLMVGTIEPRKGHLQTIGAIRQLLDAGENVCLVIVGKQGWMVDKVAEELKHSQISGSSIHWLNTISDEYLSHLYSSCDCLIAASEAEGFGLPLIEAAMQSLPIVARDIPVFREVAGDAAFYFHGETPDCLAEALRRWMEQFNNSEHPKPDQLRWLSWQDSAEQLLSHLNLNHRS